MGSLAQLLRASWPSWPQKIWYFLYGNQHKSSFAMHGSSNSQSTSHEGQHFSFFGLIRTLRYTCFKKYVHDLFSYKKGNIFGTVRSMIWIKFTEKYQQARVASPWISNSEGREGRPRRGMMSVKFNLQISYFLCLYRRKRDARCPFNAAHTLIQIT